MRWSSQQTNALRSVENWFRRSSEPVFRLFGYAGTGKTTLAKYFADEINGLVLYAAFTGKAAHVLRTKGCDNASTIHSLIYHSRDSIDPEILQLEIEANTLLEYMNKSSVKNEQDIKKYAELMKKLETLKKKDKPKFSLNEMSAVKDASLVIIDECSMVDEKIGMDLLSFGTKILVLGDPAQLPPVAGSGFFTNTNNPDIMLTDVHRQAKESPILRLATKVREGEEISIHDSCDDCQVIYKKDLNRDIIFDHEQLLVGTNKTRFSSNKRIRELKGISSPLPVVSDRIVCLRNNNEEQLLNGALFSVEDIGYAYDNLISMEIKNMDSGDKQMVLAHSRIFLGREAEIQFYERNDAQSFDYGYALTVHKSQGSQWDSVAIIDESSKLPSDSRKWLYTGITRAAKKLTLAI